jgi:hypothetical protein
LYIAYLHALAQRGVFSKRPFANGITYGDLVLTGQAGLVGYFTNHTGKSTCATQLYETGVEEENIMSRTGYLSEAADRKYRRSNSVLPENVSEVLDPP